MNNKQIEQFKSTLLKLQKELVALQDASADSRAPVQLDQTSLGRVSRIDAMQQQAMAQAQERQRTGELARITQALKRIQTGDFGFCTACDEEIAPGRLQIAPSVSLCIKCAGT